jgi:hypothetical protein
LIDGAQIKCFHLLASTNIFIVLLELAIDSKKEVDIHGVGVL